MENETFPLSEELILLYNNREALKEDSDLAFDVISTIDNAKDYKSFFWCLTNLHNFQTKEGREFAISNIFHFIYSSWFQIPEDIYPLLIDELFTKILKDPNYQDEPYYLNIFKAQNLVAYGLYPNLWADFFDFLLKLPKPNLHGFLSLFNYSTYNSASASNRDIDEFMNACLKDGSQAKLLQVVVNDVFDGVENAGNSLISTVEWISLSLLLDSEVISSFVQLMEQEDTCSIGLKIFIKITHRPIALDILYDLVTQLQLDEIIQQIASNFEEDEEIIILCSELLFSSFDKLISSEIPSLFDIIPNVTDLSMNLFMLPSSKSMNFNRRLLLNIFGCYPMVIEDYFPMLASKITLSISLESEDSDKITETSLRLLFDAARISGVDISPHLLSLSDSLDPDENIYEISVFLKALNEVLSAYEENQNEFKLNLAEIFSPLLSIQPPFYIPHFVAMSNYLQIIIQIINDFDPQIITDIFIRCVELIMSKECEEIVQSDRDDLIENIFNIVEAKPKLISTIPDIKELLPDFIQSDDINLIKSASLITSEFDAEDRFQIYSQVLPYFATELKLSIAPEGEEDQTEKKRYTYMFSSTKSKISPVLNYLVFSKTNDLEPLKPTLMEFYSSLYYEMDDIKNSSYLFGLFCKSSIEALGIDAIEIFIKTTDLIFNYENAMIIVETSIPLASEPPYDENVKLILLLIDNVVGRKRYDKRTLRHMDEELQKREFYRVASEFLMLVIPNLQEDENEFEFSNAILHLVDFLMSMELSNEMMNKVVLFFLANPAVFADKIEGIFFTFMSVLAIFAKNGSDTEFDTRELIFNFLKLLKDLASIVKDADWNSPKWNKIESLDGNGPDIMNQLMKCPEEDFEPMVNEFLENVEPQKNYYEDEYAADAEDE